MKKKLPFFENFSKKFSIGKKSDFNFQNRGYFVKKLFRKFLETSFIGSLENAYSLYTAKNFKNFFKWKKIQLEFSKSGIFWEKKSKSHQVGGTFFEATSEAKCPQLVLHVLC